MFGLYVNFFIDIIIDFLENLKKFKRIFLWRSTRITLVKDIYKIHNYTNHIA